jgi:hypothetical protein
LNNWCWMLSRLLNPVFRLLIEGPPGHGEKQSQAASMKGFGRNITYSGYASFSLFMDW